MFTVAFPLLFVVVTAELSIKMVVALETGPKVIARKDKCINVFKNSPLVNSIQTFKADENDSSSGSFSGTNPSG